MPQIELCFWATGKAPAKSLNVDLVICRFTPTSHISGCPVGTVWSHSCWKHRGIFLLENVMQRGKYIYNLEREKERENVRQRVKRNCCVTGKCFPRLAFISLWGYISAGCGVLNRWHFGLSRKPWADGMIEWWKHGMMFWTPNKIVFSWLWRSSLTCRLAQSHDFQLAPSWALITREPDGFLWQEKRLPVEWTKAISTVANDDSVGVSEGVF